MQRNVRHRSSKSIWRQVWLVVQLALACVASVASGLFAYRFVKEQEYLVSKHVDVQGHQRINAQDILEYAQVPMGEPLYNVPVEAIQRAVLRHPDVATVLVARVPPDRIVITVAEHQPMATVAVGQGVYVVNQEGALFRRTQSGEDMDLPVITGIPRGLFTEDQARAQTLVQEALAAVRAHAKAGRAQDELMEVDVEEQSGVTLRLGNPPVEVVLGRGNLDSKLTRLQALERHLQQRHEKPLKVFLDNTRHPERVAVQLAAPSQLGGG